MLTLLAVFLCSCKIIGIYSRLSHSFHPRTLNSVYSGQDKAQNLPAFQFLLSPKSICGEKLYFLVVVHSKPDRFKERELIRETWGSVTKIGGWDVRTVFVLGRSTQDKVVSSDLLLERGSQNSLKSRSLHQNAFFQSDPTSSIRYKADSTDRLVRLESDLYNDIVQGDFEDTPYNRTKKHMMGYNWVIEHCSHKPRFVLKTDDDVFIEMYHLFNFVSAVYGTNPGPSLVCDVIPAGTAPHRTRGNLLQEEKEFFNKKTHPKFCSGASYIITPDLMKEFLKATEEVPKLWIDDVYMTGLVREHLHVSPFYLNLRYTYELDRPTKWLYSKKKKPLPFIFVVPDSSSAATGR